MAAILLKEFLGYDTANASKYSSAHFPIHEGDTSEKMTEASYLADHKHDRLVKIEAMHCHPYATGNYTRYMSEACKSSLNEWTYPYERPTIMFHNDFDGTVNGRIIAAEMGHSEKTNTDVLILTASTPDWRTQDDIDTEILKTVSIGVSATDVRCSICGAKLTEGESCDHRRGEEYDGQTCYWDVYAFEPTELSYVIVPSDKFAQVVGIIDVNDEEAGKRPRYFYSNQDDNRLSLKEGQQGRNNNSSKENEQAMDDKEKLAEQVKLNESLTVTKKALENDKLALTEQVTALTKEKVELQESIKDFKEQISAKDAEIAQEKQLREAQEQENKKLQDEIKKSLVDTLTAMRESAGKPKVEKLEDRSIDSLRDAITDLKAELKEAETKQAKDSVGEAGLKEPEQTPSKKPEPESAQNEVVGLTL